MKRLITLILLFFSIHSFAQNWADTGATWHYDFSGIITQGHVEIAYTQDTLILGIEAKELQLTKSGVNLMSGQFFEELMGYEYTYSDSDHVFVLHDGQFEVLYDFSAEVGDTLTHFSLNQFFIEDCDSIGRSKVSAVGAEIINGEELRWYELEYVDGISGFTTYYSRIYEKLGAVDYMFPTDDLCGIDEDFYGPLRCFEDDDFGSYQNPDYEGECNFVYEFPIPNYFQNDPEWCMESSVTETGCHTNEDFVYYLNGSESINGNIYWNLHERGVGVTLENIPGDDYDCYNTFTFDNFLGLLRQEGEIIYFTPEDDLENEELLFDFSLSIGDTIPQSLSFDEDISGYCVVSDIDSIYMYDNYYKRFYFEAQYETMYEEDFYIEGIGHNAGLIIPYGLGFEILYFARAYRKGEIPYYQFPDGEGCDFSVSINEQEGEKFGFEIYPNPVYDQLQLKIANSIQVKNIRIYSISGKALMNLSPSKSIDISGLPSGMYLLEVESVDGFKEFKRFVKE